MRDLLEENQHPGSQVQLGQYLRRLADLLWSSSNSMWPVCEWLSPRRDRNDCDEIAVSIAIDDFGTGSSRGRLRDLPFDRIKVDPPLSPASPIIRSTLPSSPQSSALSHNLGLKCTAEDVETRRQLEVLKKISLRGSSRNPALPAHGL